MDKREELVLNIKETIWPRRITMIGFLFLISFLRLFRNSGYFLELHWITILFLFFWLLSSFALEIFASKFKTLSSLENFYCFYLFLEFVWLTLIIYFIGGITWIGGFFYWFTIMYANLHLPRKKAILMVFLGVLMFNELVIIQFLGFPTYKFLPNAPYQNVYYVVLTLGIIDCFLIYVGLVSNLIRNSFDKKSEELQRALEKLEEEQIILQIRAGARTKTVSDLSEELKRKVEESTANLKKKIQELEKLKELTKGREERLLSLKNELKKLKETSKK
jgi:hypothetical protein